MSRDSVTKIARFVRTIELFKKKQVITQCGAYRVIMFYQGNNPVVMLQRDGIMWSSDCNGLLLESDLLIKTAAYALMRYRYDENATKKALHLLLKS